MNETLFWLTYLALGLLSGFTIAAIYAKDELRSGGYPETALETVGYALLPGMIVAAFVFLWPLLVAILACGYLVGYIARAMR